MSCCPQVIHPSLGLLSDQIQVIALPPRLWAPEVSRIRLICVTLLR